MTTAIDDSHTHLRLRPGHHTLDGREALQYVRTRKSVGDGSDLGRIRRQQGFLASVMQEATSTHRLVQPTRLYAFLDAATRSLTTDPELGVGTMSDLASSVKGIGLDEIQFVTVPNEPFAPDPNRVQWKASAEQIWSALREDRQVGSREEAHGHRAPGAPHRVARRHPGRRRQRDDGPGAGSAGPGCAARPGVHRRHPVDGRARPARSGECARRVLGTRHGGGRTVAAAFPGATVRAAKGLGHRFGSPSGPWRRRSSRSPTGWARHRSPPSRSPRAPHRPRRSRHARPAPTSAPDPASPTSSVRVLPTGRAAARRRPDRQRRGSRVSRVSRGLGGAGSGGQPLRS